MTANEFFRRYPEMDDHGQGRGLIEEVMPKLGWHGDRNFRIIRGAAQRHGFTPREAEEIARGLLYLIS